VIESSNINTWVLEQANEGLTDLHYKSTWLLYHMILWCKSAYLLPIRACPERLKINL